MKHTNVKKDYFVSKMFRRLLFPSILSSLGFALSDVADALVVGRRLGAMGLAAIGLCLPLYMLINIFTDGLALGGSVRFSRFAGSGKGEQARDCFNRVLRTALGGGILFGLLVNLFAPQTLSILGAGAPGSELYNTCISYVRILAAGTPLIMVNVVLNHFLRNDSKEGIAARGFLAGNLTDVALNILFVLVFDLGAGGAALSTVIGSAVAIVCYLPGLTAKSGGFVQLGLPSPRPAEVAKCFGVGFSISVQNLFALIFLLLINRTLLRLGGEGAVAVFDVVYNASFFILYLCEGTAETAQPLVSTFSGEKSERDCRTVLRLSLRTGLLLAGVAAALIFGLSEYVARLFGMDADLLPMASRALRIYCVGFAFLSFNILLSRYAQARANAGVAFGGVLLRNLIVLVPATVLCSLAGLDYVWFLFPVTEVVSFALFAMIFAVSRRRSTLFDESRVLRLTVVDDLASVGGMLDQCDEFCERQEATPTQQYVVRLVSEEIVTSIIRNGISRVPDGRIRVTLLALPNGEFMLQILDNAVTRDFFSLRAKNDAGAGDFDIDEVSMLLIKKNAKTYQYRQCYGFNSLIVRI